MYGTSSYCSPLHSIAHDALSPASGGFSLVPVLFHGPAPSGPPPALTEELAGSSDTRELSSSPLSMEVINDLGLESSSPSQQCRHTADGGTKRTLAIDKSDVRNPLCGVCF